MKKSGIRIALIGVIGLFSFCRGINDPELPHVEKITIVGGFESDISNAILTTNGDVWTWGYNISGQLGNGTTKTNDKPQRIKALKNVVSIDLSDGAAVAADNYGNIWFWGNHLIWNEPQGYDTIVTTPQKISFLKSTIKVEIFGSKINALCNDGSIFQINLDHNAPTKYQIPIPTTFSQNIATFSENLILEKNGLLFSFPDRNWIPNEKGGIINLNLSDIKSVQNINMAYSLVLKKDSTVWAWGQNKTGTLGDGTYSNCSNPKIIDCLKSITMISANSSRCLALGDDGSVWFWGLVFLDLSENIIITEPKPIKIDGLENIKMMYASPVWELLFLKNDGSFLSYNVRTKEIKNLKLEE